MSESSKTTSEKPEQKAAKKPDRWYLVQFRQGEQIHTASARIQNLHQQEKVMVATQHGLEPAHVTGLAPQANLSHEGKPLQPLLAIHRRCNRDEQERYDRLIEREETAFTTCQQMISKHQLAMKLIKVERFFNGSKIIFYFTADNRVDFRALVKDLVQEFRTRVEMRQVGVRHETKMIGGIGSCGRELCCSSFIDNFAPVSIKMAKEQNLPLNPTKISGICNRLLCCLTYEFPTYRRIRKEMPRCGRTIQLEGNSWKVIKQNILTESLTVVDPKNRENCNELRRDQWEKAQKSSSNKPPRSSKSSSKGGGKASKSSSRPPQHKGRGKKKERKPSKPD